MKKIVIIHNRLVIGGPAVAIAQTIKKLNTQFEFFLIVGKPLPDELDAAYLFEGLDNLTIIHLDKMRRMPNVLGDIASYFELKKIIKKLKPNVVHTHGTKPGLLGRLVASALKVPVIIHTYHGHIFHSYFNSYVSSWVVRMERMLARKTTNIIVLSQQLKNDIVTKYKIANPEKVHIIQLGLDLGHFIVDANSKRKSFRSSYNVKESEIAIGIVGRITAIKNMHLFAEVIVALRDKEFYEKLKFFIVGDGEEKDKLELYLLRNKISISNSNENAKVFFTSWLTNMDEVMNGLDIVCLTSLNEGTPVCLIEAMASKKAIVTTDAGSIPEMIENNKSGLLVKGSSLQQFVENLEALITSNELRKNLGENAYKYVENLYMDDTVWVKMANLYNKID